MDATLVNLINEAQKAREAARGSGAPGTHGANAAQMIRYCQENGFIKPGGREAILAGQVSQEHLAITTEMAAMMIEMHSNERIGSILSLSDDQKRELIARA